MSDARAIGPQLVSATSDMAHPQGYSFLMTLMLTFFIGFVFAVLAQSHFNERETAVVTFGFMVGGFVFAWLLGVFDSAYGLASGGGFGLVVIGLGFLVLRGEGRNG